MAVARLSFADYTGTTDIREKLDRIEKYGYHQCWRDLERVKQQVLITLRLIWMGLARAQREDRDQKMRAFRRLETRDYWYLHDWTERAASRAWSKEKARLDMKEANLKRVAGDCTKHRICKWMKRFTLNIQESQ